MYCKILKMFCWNIHKPFLRNIFLGILEPTMICPPISVCCLSCFPGFEIHWNKYSWGFKGTQRNRHWIWPYGRKFIWESQHWIWRTKGMYVHVHTVSPLRSMQLCGYYVIAIFSKKFVKMYVYSKNSYQQVALLN